MKICNRCKIEKSLDSFYKDKTKLFGVGSTCKECEKIRSHYRNLKEVTVTVLSKVCKKCNQEKDLSKFPKCKTTTDGLAGSCKECTNKQYNEYCRKNPEVKFFMKIKQTYGLTKQEYLEALRLCGGRCTICTKKRKLVVDHHHESGKFRGLICGKCNTGLGMFEENYDVMVKSVFYLKSFHRDFTPIFKQDIPTSNLLSNLG